MLYNMMVGYDVYDCFTMEHFRLRQRMTLTIKIYCSRLYIQSAQKCGSKFFDWSRQMTLFYRDLFYAWQRRYLNLDK
jgi:hypothetical protein